MNNSQQPQQPPQKSVTPQDRERDAPNTAPNEQKKRDGGGLSTGVDTGAMQPGKTGDARP